MVDQTVNEFSRIDVLIMSAGIHDGGNTVVDTPVDGWDKVIDIDLKGVYLSSKLVISEMKKVGCGAIVNISSIGRLTGQSYAMAFQSAF
jgi:NAD(P)-dependent dehydrogenase (short-subunit alcohol dehydrogenase family)